MKPLIYTVWKEIQCECVKEHPKCSLLPVGFLKQFFLYLDSSKESTLVFLYFFTFTRFAIANLDNWQGLATKTLLQLQGPAWIKGYVVDQNFSSLKSFKPVWFLFPFASVYGNEHKLHKGKF